MSGIQEDKKITAVATKSGRQITGEAECPNCKKLQQENKDLLENMDAVWNSLQKHVEAYNKCMEVINRLEAWNNRDMKKYHEWIRSLTPVRK